MTLRLRQLTHCIAILLLTAFTSATIHHASAQETIGGPYTADTSTVVLLHFDGDYTNESTLEVADGEPTGLVSFQDTSAQSGLGQSIYIDNNNEDFNFVTVADTPAVDLTGDWTMEAWMNVDEFNDFNNFPRLIFKPGDPVFLSNWYLAPHSNGYVRGGFRHDGGSWHNHDTQSGIIGEDTWYHLTYIRDTERNATIQLIHDQDGNLILAEKAMYPEGVNPVTTEEPIYVGVNPGNNSMKFIGHVDEVRISNVVREFSDVNVAFISDVTSLESQSSETPDYPVSATVDLFGPGNLEVLLQYRIDGGAFQQIAMTNAEGDTYEATIPQQEGGSTVEYYVDVQVDGETNATSPSNAIDAENYYKFNVVVPDQQVLALDFETGSGEPVDSSDFGDQHTVEIVGNESYSTDAAEGTYSFELDGSTHLEINESPYLISPTTTVDLWFKATAMPDSSTRLVAKEGTDDWTQANYQVWFGADGVLNGSAAPGLASVTLDTTITTDTWYRVVYMISAGAASLQLWNDSGELLDAQLTTVASEPPVAEGPFRIGHAGEGTDPFFTGLVDDVQIYNYPAVNGPLAIVDVTQLPAQSSDDENYPVYADVRHAGAGEVNARLYYEGNFGWSFINMERIEDGQFFANITTQEAGRIVPYYVTASAPGDFADESPDNADQEDNNYTFGVFEPFTKVLELDFEEGSGTPADASMYAASQPVEPFGDPQFSEDAAFGDYSLELEGDSSYLEIDSPFLSAPEFTVDFWFSADEIKGGERMVIKQGDPATTGAWHRPNYQIFLRGAGDVRAASFTVDDGLNGGNLDFDSTLVTESWYHLTYEYDVDTAYVQLRDADDNIVEEVGYVPNTPAAVTNGPFRVGVGGNDNNFNGRIDRVRVFNYAVSQRAPAIDSVSTYRHAQDVDAAPYSIDAFVEGDADVTLHHRVDGGEWQTAEMQAGTENEYSAEIPAQAFGTVVEYYVSAEDEFGNRVTDPATAESENVYRELLVAGQEELVLDLTFEEGSGTPEDQSAFSHEVTMVGNPTYSTDAAGGEYSMAFAEDDSSYLELFSPFLSSPQFTVDFWFKVDNMEGIGGAHMVAQQGDETTTGNWWQPTYQVFLHQAGVLRGATFVEGSGLNGGNLEIESTIEEGVWYRAIYEFNEDSARVQVRDVDDNVVDEVSTTGGQAATTRGAFRIAHAGFEEHKYFIGKIDNVRIYNYAINADEVGVGAEDEEVPKEFALKQNYPNPFNPTTTIEYTLPAAADVTLKIFDVLGREVTTLVDSSQPSGRHEVTFRADGLASGLYFYQVEAEDQVLVKKMILMK